MNAASTRESETFLRALHGRHTDFIELRLKNDGGKWHSEFFPAGELERAALQAEKLSSMHDVYCGVGARDGKGGTQENMTNLPAVWVDVDLKDGVTRDTLRERISGLPRPAMIVNSGGGWHLYWILKEASGPDGYERVRNINSALAAILGGDQGATDPARILRVPGTLNRKKEYGTPRPVQLLEVGEAEYNLSDFDLFSPAGEHDNTNCPKSSSVIASIVKQCTFFHRWDQGAKNLPEPLRYAGIGILARMPGGVDYVHAISRRHADYSHKETDAKILHALNDAGPRTCKAIKTLWECGRDCGIKSPAVLALKEEGTSEETASGGQRDRIPLFDDVCLALRHGFPSPVWLVKRLIERGFIQLFGPTGSMKSFIAMYLSFVIATGGKFFGREVKSGPVIYICGEGRSGAYRRFAGLEIYYGTEIPEGNLFLSNRAVNLDAESVPILRDEIESSMATAGRPPEMVVVDTLARSLDGDENSTEDMARFVAACDGISAKFGCSIFVVHHTGHSPDAQNRGRGASNLPCAADTIIACRNQTLTWTKTKDSELPKPIPFAFKKVDLGPDEDGEPIDTIVIVESGEGAASAPHSPRSFLNLKPGERLAMETLIELSANGKFCDGRRWVGVNEWRAEYAKRYWEENPKTKEKAHLRDRKSLVTKELVSVESDCYAVIRPEDVARVEDLVMFAPLMGNLLETGDKRRHLETLSPDMMETDGDTPPVGGVHVSNVSIPGKKANI